MKKNKIVLIFVGLLFLTSCGPKRLGCGPRRCEVKSSEIQKINVQKNPEMKIKSGLV